MSPTSTFNLHSAVRQRAPLQQSLTRGEVLSSLPIGVIRMTHLFTYFVLIKFCNLRFIHKKQIQLRAHKETFYDYIRRQTNKRALCWCAESSSSFWRCCSTSAVISCTLDRSNSTSGDQSGKTEKLDSGCTYTQIDWAAFHSSHACWWLHSITKSRHT